MALRSEVFERAGGWADEFFYAHEGIDLAWRVWDDDAVAWYAGDIVVHHPANDPARNDLYYRYNARNRVYIARRNLPVPLVPVYVGLWILLTVFRLKPRSACARGSPACTRDGDAVRAASPSPVAHRAADVPRRPAAGRVSRRSPDLVHVERLAGCRSGGRPGTLARFGVLDGVGAAGGSGDGARSAFRTRLCTVAKSGCAVSITSSVNVRLRTRACFTRRASVTQASRSCREMSVERLSLAARAILSKLSATVSGSACRVTAAMTQRWRRIRS